MKKEKNHKIQRRCGKGRGGEGEGVEAEECKACHWNTEGLKTQNTCMQGV